MSRLLPWVGLPLVVAVGLVSFNAWVSSAQPYLGFYVDFADWTATDAMPALVPGSPSWHLAYLAALGGLAGCGALLRDAHRRWLPVLSGAVLAAAVGVTGVLQLR